MSKAGITSMSFSNYYSYDELTHALQRLSLDHPDLAKLESAGKSLEHRDIWVLRAGNSRAGDPDQKPAIYVDGNIHAAEIAASAVPLYLAHYLVENYGEDPWVTRLMDTRTFYILPRVNPDGAEVCLTTPHASLGTKRVYPKPDNRAGLNREDMDGDGYILDMRIPDPNGEWKLSSKDPRLMIPREVYDVDGEFYRIYSEGRLVGGADPDDFSVLRRQFDFNLNRTFPAGWNIEKHQAGGGDYPLQEPESRAIADFLLSHKNIGAVMAYHTYGGVLLRPFSWKADEGFSREDLGYYKELGRVAKTLTGYDMVSIYDGFTPVKSKPRRGVLTDWTYEHLGLLSCSTEIWDPAIAAGVRRESHFPTGGASEEDELRMLEWNDKHLGGKGFKDWTDFDHPDFGMVQIGGWRRTLVQTNPPVQHLEEECRKNALVCLAQAAMLPEIRIKKASITPIEPRQVKVKVVIENIGYLPTNVTALALDIAMAGGVTAEISLPDGASLVTGSTVKQLGHVPGKAVFRDGIFFGRSHRLTPRKTATATWAVNLARGFESAVFSIAVSSEKAGVVAVELAASIDSLWLT